MSDPSRTIVYTPAGREFYVTESKEEVREKKHQALYDVEGVYSELHVVIHDNQGGFVVYPGYFLATAIDVIIDLGRPIET